MEIPRRRQLSVIDKIAATRGPAVGLPMWIQFFLPIATPRMEFSARLLLSSISGNWRKFSSLGQSPST